MNLSKEEMKEKITDFIDETSEEIIQEGFYSGTTFKIPYKDVSIHDHDLAFELIDEPGTVLSAFEEALRDYYNHDENDMINVEINQLTEDRVISPDDLCSEYIGKYISLKGLVRTVIDPEPVPNTVMFECERCGSLTEADQDSKYIERPLECSGCGKSQNQTNFEPLLEHPKTEYSDRQEIYIQGIENTQRAGERSRTVKAILYDENVNKLASGDETKLNGIYRVKESKGRNKKINTTFEVKSVEIMNKEFDDGDLTDEEERRVDELAERDDIFDLLVDSTAPAIKGNRDIKKAMVLQFFGGVRKEVAGTMSRGDMHMLLAGDPEMAKSDLLDFAAGVVPRAMKGSGKTTSGPGLIGAATQSEDGVWKLEAGILEMADKGLACIDELDKMSSSDRHSIHKAMEQQEISISKANIRATLKTRTPIFAACNPPHGKFTKSEKVDKEYMEVLEEQLDPPLLSRFDFIWIMTSEVADHDSNEITEHILKQQIEYSRKMRDNGYEVGGDYKAALNKEDYRNYIKKGRSIKPEFTAEVSELIEEYYNDLLEELERDMAPRLLKSLVRLSEASAKAHHREKVLPEDAKRAIELKTAEIERWKFIGLDPDKYLEKKTTGFSEKESTIYSQIQETMRDLSDSEIPPHKVNRDQLVKAMANNGHDQEQIQDAIEYHIKQGNLSKSGEPGVIRNG